MNTSANRVRTARDVVRFIVLISFFNLTAS
jgi:hypothetical protein